MNRRTVLRGAVGVSAAAVAATITKVSKATYEDPVEVYRSFDVEAWRAQVPKILGPWRRWSTPGLTGFSSRDNAIGEPLCVHSGGRNRPAYIHARVVSAQGRYADSREEADAILRAHGWTLLEAL